MSLSVGSGSVSSAGGPTRPGRWHAYETVIPAPTTACARGQLTSALRRLTEALGRDHPERAAVLYALGAHWHRACRFIQEAVEIYDTRLGEHHPRTIASRDLLQTITAEIETSQ